MYDITLVCTQHKESGNCNALTLYNIIEGIEPEVIFEELSLSHFHESYEQNKLITLETTAVKEYLKSHTIKHIPVDTYPLPKTYYEAVDRLYRKLYYSNMIQECRDLRYLSDNYTASANQHGFRFLNSDENDRYFEKVILLKEKLLNIMNDENLFHIYRLEKAMIEKREHEILENVYNFSAGTPFNNAMMMIGSGHRKSISSLIEEVKMQERIQLNWRNYSN